jgi:hypothetical protein
MRTAIPVLALSELAADGRDQDMELQRHRLAGQAMALVG